MAKIVTLDEAVEEIIELSAESERQGKTGEGRPYKVFINGMPLKTYRSPREIRYPSRTVGILLSRRINDRLYTPSEPKTGLFLMDDDGEILESCSDYRRPSGLSIYQEGDFKSLGDSGERSILVISNNSVNSNPFDITEAKRDFDILSKETEWMPVNTKIAVIDQVKTSPQTKKAIHDAYDFVLSTEEFERRMR